MTPTRGAPPAEHLAALGERVASLEGHATRLVSELSEAELAWRPANGWSIAQIFEHLRLTNERYLSRIRVAVRSAASRVDGHAGDAGEPWRPTLLGRAIARVVGSGSGPRLWAPPGVRPEPEPTPGAAEAYRRQLAELARLLLESRGLDLTGTRVDYPFWPRLGINLGDAFEIVIGHAERHTAQAGRVLSRAERPRGVGR